MEACYNPFSLEGKRILITGASSGIGRATAIECSKMGADLIITGRNESRLQETFELLGSSDNHQMILGDLANTDDLKTLVNSIPTINGVVECAGRGYTTPIQFEKVEEVKKVFDTNFFANLELLRLLYKKKKIEKNGSIVIVASIGGNFIFKPGNAMYGTSKAAVNSLMKFAAIEFSSRLIRVNSVCPGMVETPLINKGVFSDENKEKDIKEYPLKRYGQPNDVANGIIYLLSDASSWVTGHSLVIDGGVTI